MNAKDMTPDQIAAEKAKIDALTQEKACELWRFAPAGHIWFQSDGPLFSYFEARFKELGGWTPAISKKIGW